MLELHDAEREKRSRKMVLLNGRHATMQTLGVIMKWNYKPNNALMWQHGS